MSDARLGILLTADVSSGVQGLKQTSEALDETSKAAQTAATTWKEFVGQRMGQYMKQFGSHGAAIKQIAEEWKNYKNQISTVSPALQRLSTTTNSANNVLINTGRIFQDLPFGILGVANNINPLIESFQRLSAESKETGTSLGRNLLQSLKGGGGLGIAFSLITAAASFATIGLSFFSRGLNKTKKDADDTAVRIKELTRSINDVQSDVISGAIGSTAGDIAKVQALSQAIQDQTKSYKERNNALNQLKEINKNYFGDLTLEQSKLGALKKAVDDYTNALVAQAVVKGFTDEIAKVSAELSKQKDKYNELKSAAESFGTIGRKSGDKTFVATGALNNELGELTRQQQRANSELEKQGLIVFDLESQYTQLFSKIKGAVGEAIKFKPLSGDAKKDIDKFINETIAKAKELEKQFGDIKLFPDLEVDFNTTKKDVFKNALQVLRDFPAFRIPFKIQPVIDEIEDKERVRESILAKWIPAAKFALL